MTPARLALAVCAASLAFAGCSCEEKTSKRYPKIEVLDGAGAQRSSVDFGQVQVNATATQMVRVRNSGTASLTLTGATFSNPKFGVGVMLPVSVDTAGELQLPLTFRPVDPDVRVTGTVTLATDDPQNLTVQLSLSGTGVTAVAVASPTTVAFGAVYVLENKTITLTLTNAGSNDLVVRDARFSTGVPAEVTGAVADFKKTLAAGESASVAVTFAPTAMVEVAGAVEIDLGPDLGALSVPLTGEGVQALPKLCFKYDDEGTERCTDQTNTFLSLNVGSFCDNRLYPPDGGPSACVGLDGGVVGPARSAKLYYRNEGNTPVSYSLQYQAQVGNLCDGGSSIDFELSNAPAAGDGGTQASWTEATTRLPNQATDSRPWETAPISVTYRPSSRCAQDGADQARVLWTRQGEPSGTTRLPQTLILNLTGQSLLPRGVAQEVTMMGSAPLQIDYRGMGNAGDAPLQVHGVTLWQAESLALPDGGTSRGTVPFAQCVSGSTGDCAVFSWVPGQDPSVYLPATLAGTPNPVPPTTTTVGRLVFGAADAGIAPSLNHEYRVFAVFETDDPYNAQVVSNIRATAR